MTGKLRVGLFGGWAICRFVAVVACLVVELVLVSQSQAVVVPTTELVSVTSAGVHMRAVGAGAAAISGKGRYIAFTRGGWLFLRDRLADTTRRVVRGAGWPAFSRDGRFVAFATRQRVVWDKTSTNYDVFVWNRTTGRFHLVSTNSRGGPGNLQSWAPALSAHGRYVAFTSGSWNLVRHDNNRVSDVFVHDRATGRTVRVSVGPHGSQANGRSDAPAISANGRYVAFYSYASNLVRHDTNGQPDVFIRDRWRHITRRISVSSSGAQGDGRSFIGVDISADGRYVLFESEADNLVAGDTNDTMDDFIRDRTTHTTTRVSVATGGQQGDQGGGGDYASRISADGRYVAFASDSSNLVPGDTNNTVDVFIRDLELGTTTRVSVTSNGGQTNGANTMAALSADGRFVVFLSDATNLSPLDQDAYADTYDRGPLH